MAGIQYSIKKNRLSKARMEGIELQEDGSLLLNEGENYHLLVLGALDSAIPDCPWGRLFFEAELPADSACYIYAAAANEKAVMGPEGEVMVDSLLLDTSRGNRVRRQFLEGLGGVRFINSRDVLLYSRPGRYLWIAIEVIGDSGMLKNIRVQAPGDNFMGTFPEVYQEKNSFFHRYMSVFSTLYNDFQEELDHRERLLDVDTAPEERLVLFARWLGLDVSGGFLDVETLRTLVREAGELTKWKGTRRSISRICELMLGEKPVIVERSSMQGYVRREEREVYDRMYGSSPYDVTLLIGSYVDEKRKDQLLHLLRQFKPARSRLRIVFLESTGILDGHSYMDRNAQTFLQAAGRLDEAQAADGTIILM